KSKIKISTPTTSEPAAAPAAPVRERAPTASTGDQGYAVSVTCDGETTEHIIIATNISEAAQAAVQRANGVVTAVRYLGPAL
ncbi:MAG: hypothetical protein ACI8S6_002712, partial [Myxococcota bacterium]